jgi:acyl-CoA thioesterase I
VSGVSPLITVFETPSNRIIAWSMTRMISYRMTVRNYRSPYNLRFSCAVAVFGLLVLFSAACGRDGTPGPTPVGPPPQPAAVAPADPSPAVVVPKPLDTAYTGPRPKIVAFGDSLTAGYGLAQSDSYPSLLQMRLEESGYHYEVVNAGVSGETSAGGVRRIDRALQGDVGLVIVELGGNDGLRGLPVDDLKRNLTAIIKKAKAKGAPVVLAGMEAPPQFGEEYTALFRNVFKEVAREQGVPLIPFFLEGVAGDPDLNQVDGIHPNSKGAKIVTEVVFRNVEPLLKKT